jgi:4-alpha-glucanotransferase
MSDEALARLAVAAGVNPTWKDVFGQTHRVSPESLRAVLNALELPAATDTDISESLRRATFLPETLPPLVTADLGLRVALPAPPARYSLTHADGRVFDGFAEPAVRGCTIPPILEIGYHRLTLGDEQTIIAVAPRACFTPGEAVSAAKSWGLAVQLYALRRNGDGGIGDFLALAELAAPAAALGAQAIAISPVHAQFSADLNRFSPYAPSSRTALNVLHGSIDTGNAALESLSLVDWPEASRFRLAQLRKMFEAAQADPAQCQELADFIAAHGARLRPHAVFEALHAHFFGHNHQHWHWRNWPAAFQTPDSPEVSDFAVQNAETVTFHIWLQLRADRELAAAQRACRDAGMGIGIISDLAVGTDSGGSQCWSRPGETLLGLTVGAPPDLLQRHGQNWGLTAFSPRGLTTHGFGTYREMLHTALEHAGGMRIDHAMGLNRLWVIPEGAKGSEGAYLDFPERDLIRLITLESHVHRAIVLAEDLGTVPEGFQDRLRDAAIAGMRVLWFERDQAQNFIPPSHWTQRAAAMTSTHDLATLAGWWQGRDIAWREKLGLVADPVAAHTERTHEKHLLWQAIQQSGAAAGAPPNEPAAFADAAITHVGRSACELVMLPIEDALALPEQPNLPGTIDEHPNWRRRLDAEARNCLDDDATTARLRALQKARQDS